MYKDTKSISVPPIKVWFFNPSKSRNKRVLFVMHGIERNGEAYRNSWIEHAKEGEFLLLVPEFSKQNFPDHEQYNLGNMYSQSGASHPKSKWTFTTIENLFDYVKNTNKLNVAAYNIYGHSAGAQFVHRLVLFMPESRIDKAIAANAGWYTFPDFETQFPFGLKNTFISAESIKTSLAKRLIILLGSSDNNPNHKHLNKSSEAMRQGSNRFDRGEAFFKQAISESNKLNSILNWEKRIVPNGGHSNSEMSDSAFLILNNIKELL